MSLAPVEWSGTTQERDLHVHPGWPRMNESALSGCLMNRITSRIVLVVALY